MALGLPCVVNNVGGLINIVNDEVGSFCDKTEEFSKEIIKILTDKKIYEQLSLEAINRSKKMDNYSEYMMNIRRLYEREK